MAIINEKCEFYTKVDQVELRTNTSEDKIIVSRLNLSQEQAASLSWLINATGTNTELHFEIKVKGT